MSAKLPSLKNLSSRQRSFCKRFVAGEEGEAIIADLWPGRDASWMLCRLMANERLTALFASVIRKALLLRLSEILRDPKSSRTNVLDAARLYNHIFESLGSTAKNGKKRGTAPPSPIDIDKDLQEKLLDLEKKATSY
jgi:hypothetical protein